MMNIDKYKDIVSMLRVFILIKIQNIDINIDNMSMYTSLLKTAIKNMMEYKMPYSDYVTWTSTWTMCPSSLSSQTFVKLGRYSSQYNNKNILQAKDFKTIIIMLRFIIGADISKDKINFALRFLNDYLLEKEVENTTSALNKFIKQVQSLVKNIAKEKKAEYSIEFIMEHTGIYGNLLIECLAGHKVTTYVVAGLEIKNSTGISRGKNDKIDAKRIADYGVRFADKMKPYTFCDQTLTELKGLNTLRSQLVRIKAQLTQAKDDNKKFQIKSLQKKLENINKPIVNELDKSIEKIEFQMLELIKSDESIYDNYKIAQSVPGVGKIVAVAFICATNNFTKFQSAKALGSYCGVVPFGKESGRYKGKDKVSPIANKALKTLLHLGAVASIGGKNAFAAYYQRKVMDDKKNKMLALNNVRNKIVKTLFACIKNKTKYTADYVFSFAA